MIRSPDTRASRIAFAVLGGLLLASQGCVAKERSDVEAARVRYEACVEAHGEGSPACDAAREAMLDAQARYEERARMRWGCDPGAESCPEDR